VGVTRANRHAIALSDESRWLLTMTMGGIEMHRESFLTLPDALGQVEFLLQDFTREGWTEVFRADPPKT